MLDAEARFEEERRRLYRAYLHTYVTRASPLLVDAIEIWDIDMARALRRMRPPTGWPMRWRSPGRRRQSVLARPEKSRASSKSNLLDRLHGTVCVPSPDDRRTLDVEIVSWTLQPRMGLGTAVCYGVGGTIEVWVPGALPHTLAVAAVGRPLRDVVDHALFHLRPYPITSVDADIAGFGVVTARAPLLARPTAWSVV